MIMERIELIKGFQKLDSLTVSKVISVRKGAGEIGGVSGKTKQHGLEFKKWWYSSLIKSNVSYNKKLQQCHFELYHEIFVNDAKFTAKINNTGQV